MVCFVVRSIRLKGHKSNSHFSQSNPSKSRIFMAACTPTVHIRNALKRMCDINKVIQLLQSNSPTRCGIFWRESFGRINTKLTHTSTWTSKHSERPEFELCVPGFASAINNRHKNASTFPSSTKPHRTDQIHTKRIRNFI